MPGLILIAQDMDLSFPPENFSRKRVISDDLPKRVAFGETQYITYTNDEK